MTAMTPLFQDTKPDFAEVRQRWSHYWAGEVYQRPIVIASAPKPGKEMAWGGNSYQHGMYHKWEEQCARIDHWLDNMDFLGEALPSTGPDLGPSQFAAFFGAELKCVEGSWTSWVDPIIEDWASVLPLHVDTQNHWWRQMMDYCHTLQAHSRGRYILEICDLHSNFDALAALRGDARLCMDLYDTPELVAEAMRNVRAAYQPIYDGLYDACGLSHATGSCGWVPFWCEGKFATIQCDAICLTSPEMSREYIIPALEEEANFLDHCVYHLDGPGTLVHLDDLLSIKRIDAIQWVSGDGQPAMHTWRELLHKIHDAGKGLIIYSPSCEQVKEMHREFGPRGMVYQPGGTRDEILELMDWLVANT